MRFFKLMTFVSGEDYETHEKLIDEPTFRKFQRAFVEGKTHLMLEDRVIKMSSIKEILPADDIIAHRLKMGYTLAEMGFKDTEKLEEAKQAESSGFAKKLGEGMKMLD